MNRITRVITLVLIASTILTLTGSCTGNPVTNNQLANLILSACVFGPQNTAQSFNTPVGFIDPQVQNYEGYQVIDRGNGEFTHIFGNPDQFKIVIILQTNDPLESFDLATIYMSYTEKFGSGDLMPKVWKASAGSLVITPCPDTGKGWAAIGHFAPLSDSATGEFDMKFTGRT
jgi:hypothetical protein